MLKGTRDGILKRVQPVSIHGQVTWDVFFTDVEDPDGQTHLARIGPEAVSQNLEPGDRIQVEYLVGVAVKGDRGSLPTLGIEGPVLTSRIRNPCS